MTHRATEAALDGDGDEGEDEQQRRGGERLCTVEQPGGVDDPGERVVAEQLDGAELAEAVEEHDEHAAEHRAADAGQHDPHERAGPCVAEQAGALLERRRQAGQPCRDRQVDVRIGEQRSARGTTRRARGTAAAGGSRRARGRCAAAPSGARPAMNAAAPTNDGNTSGSGASTRHSARERHVGAHQQPRQPGAEDAGRHADDDRQLHGAPQRRHRLAEHVADVGVERDQPATRRRRTGCREHRRAMTAAISRSAQGRSISPRGRRHGSSPGSTAGRHRAGRARCRPIRRARSPAGSRPARRPPPAGTRRSGRRSSAAPPPASRKRISSSASSVLSALSSIDAPVTITRLPMSSTGKLWLTPAKSGSWASAWYT